MSKCWIYHEKNEPVIVDAEEAQSYYDHGWADTPAKFVKTTDFGIDPKDEVAVQALGETIEGVKDQLNGALNLDEMNKQELMDYAEKHYSVKLEESRRIDHMRGDIKKLIEA